MRISFVFLVLFVFHCFCFYFILLLIFIFFRRFKVLCFSLTALLSIELISFLLLLRCALKFLERLGFLFVVFVVGCVK